MRLMYGKLKVIIEYGQETKCTIMVSRQQKTPVLQYAKAMINLCVPLWYCFCINFFCEAWIQKQPFQSLNPQSSVLRRNGRPTSTDFLLKKQQQLSSRLMAATKEDTKVWTASFETSSLNQKRQSRSSVQQQQPKVMKQVSSSSSNSDDQQKQQQQKQSNEAVTTMLEKEYIDDEAPAGIVGAQFFGGNKEKEEFFDPIAEAEVLIKVVSPRATTTATATSTISIDENIPASITATATTTTTTTTTISSTINDDDSIIDRFIAIDGAFDCLETRTLARDIQYQINQVLYDDDNDSNPQTILFPYSTTSIQWDTPFSKSTTNPLHELQKCVEFYRRIDVAIIAGKKLSETKYELRYEIAITWPTLWEPRILLTGVSYITLSTDKTTIIRQQDIVDQNELIPNIMKQFIPRFWDIYHLGVAPSAEINPSYIIPNIKNPLSKLSYKLYTIPPRTYLQPSINEQSINRVEQNTAFIPNHSFSCSIVTMGPLKQRFSTTSQIYISINNNKDNVNNNRNIIQLQWEIPLSVEYMSNTYLNVPTKDEDSMIDINNQRSQYVHKPKRVYASVPYYGSSPQAEEVAQIREQLYQKVILDDKYQAALDSSGRAKFVFIQNNVKACFTEFGFGMSIYDWRPMFASPNEIGIELVDNSSAVIRTNQLIAKE